MMTFEFLTMTVLKLQIPLWFVYSMIESSIKNKEKGIILFHVTRPHAKVGDSLGYCE